MMEVKVEGLQDLRKLLMQELPYEIRAKALQSSLAKAAQPIVQDARQRVAVRSGRLRKAIYSYRSRRSTLERAVRMIAVRSGRRHGARDAYYWRWVEFGRGVVTVGKKRGAARGGERARSLGNPQVGWFGREVKAMPAQPFLRPAFESKKLAALDRFQKVMAPEIQKAAARLHARNRAKLRRKVFGI